MVIKINKIITINVNSLICIFIFIYLAFYPKINEQEDENHETPAIFNEIKESLSFFNKKAGEEFPKEKNESRFVTQSIIIDKFFFLIFIR